MKHDELSQWYRRYGPMGPDAPEPVFAEKGEGAWLVDAEGGKLLDFACGGALPLGHTLDRVLGTRSESSDDSVMSRAALGADGVLWRSEVTLMHKLTELVPGGMNRRVLVCESGREALARAIELARNRTNRTCVTYLSQCTDDRLAIGKDIAAVVAHPLDGRIKQARQACDAAGALLIDDEAGIGPGTTGRMFAIELSDVRPDIYVLGRGWAAGFPFGACVTRSSSLRWKCAAAGNPIGCGLALETIRLLETGLLEQGRKLAAHIEKRFGALSSPKLEPVLWGIGLVRTIVFRKGKDVAEGFVHKCRELGLLLMLLGTRSESSEDSGKSRAIAVRPPLVANEKDVDFAAEVLGKVLAGFDKKA
jgi:acetylornithine/succinyldiaminopimelate/putrescine aminotransferase